MFGKIKFVKNLNNALSYNEQKLRTGKAECLLTENFIKDLDQLTLEDKRDRFNQRNSLNERSNRKGFHVILSFNDKEKISDRQMKDIALRYMESAGLSEQPYIVYRHYDSAQPHMHIVGSSINTDGSRIAIPLRVIHEIKHKIGEWENEFSLVKWERVKAAGEEKCKVQQAQKVVYGQRPLRRSISDVLHTVIDDYKYTSLSEFNAVLRLYNVRAYRGKENSRLYHNKGLLYYAIDERGVRVGKSIKASSFPLKPTLANLEKRFALNQSHSQLYRLRLINAIDGILIRQSLDLAAFRVALQKQHITTVMQKDKAGQPLNIWYIDQQTHWVFDGAAFGGRYTIQAIQQRCISELAYKELEQDRLRQLQQQRTPGHGHDYSLSL